tara:strand:+ start:147 stop:1364 length:1218 start_codon:yes stop_codon:yes gene_type:complete
MSTLFKENNKENTKLLYAKKILYDVIIDESEYENLIDFYFAERYLYGRVDSLYLPIVVDTDRVPLATISTTNTEQTGLQALSFVVAAFNDLNQQFSKKQLSGQIDTTDPYLSVLEAKKGYQDPQFLYNEYINKIVEVAANSVKEQNIKISNFNQFASFFDSFVSKMIGEMPLTFSGFVKSKYCPMNVSGLVIDISDQSFANDDEKIKNFKESKNWNFYLNACRSFGFYVDKSNPFRLIANIGSEEMLTYARNTSGCLFTSTIDILSSAYKPTYLNELQIFRTLMFNLYQLVKKPYIVYEMCNQTKTGTTIQKTVFPEELTVQQFNKKYSNQYFLKKYMSIRIKESKVKLETYEQKKIINDTLSILRTKNDIAAVSSFEKVIAETFNYSGSLTDLLNNGILSNSEG